MTEQSNNPVSTRTRETPLCLQGTLKEFKFHVLLECGECRMTTLGNDLLRFITKTQEIVERNGNYFRHPLKTHIWTMVVKCNRLGDGGKMTVQVPFDDAKKIFDWKTNNPAMKTANLWVRVFEVGSECVAKAEAIQADINIAEKCYAYWQRVSNVVWSDTAVLESCSLSWKEAVASVDRELVEAKEKYAEAHRTWMERIGDRMSTNPV